MSVFRRKYRNSKGEEVVSPYFSYWFQTADKRVCRGSTKMRDRRSAEAREREIRTQEEQHESGLKVRGEDKKTFEQHVDEFVAYLKNDLGRSEMYCYTAGQRLKRMALEAGWRNLRQITLRNFEDWRREAAKTPGAKRTPWRGRKPGAKTLNQYLDVARRFMGWAKKRGKVRHNQLVDAEHQKVIDNNDYRRAGTPDELSKALALCDPYQKRFWRFAVYMPLRRRTLKALLWGDSHEADSDPWMAIRGEIVKGGRFLRLPLRRDIAEMLKEWRAELNPSNGDNIFPRVPDMDEWRSILEKAGVPFDYGGRRRWDLHAMRKTAIAWMQAAGVPLAEAMIMLGHKDQRTTAKYYAEAPDPRTIKAVEKMPGLGGVQ
jgi:integrase